MKKLSKRFLRFLGSLRTDFSRDWAHVPPPNWACSRRKNPMSVYW